MKRLAGRGGISWVMAILVFALVNFALSADCQAVSQSTWQLIGPGGGGHSTSLIVDHSDPKVLFTSINCGGVRRSVDGGQSWDICNDGFDYENLGIRAHKVTALAQHPTNAQVLLAALQDGQIVASSDRGEKWSLSYNMPGTAVGQSFSYFTFDPKDPDVVYTSVGGSIDRLLTPVGTENEDRRQTKLTRGYILKGQRQPNNQWKWVVIGELQSSNRTPLNSYSCGVNPQETSELFFVTSGGLYRGKLEGEKVSPQPVDHLKSGLPAASDFDGGKMVFDPRRKGRVYLSVMKLGNPKGGFFRSDDAGRTWRKMTRGLDTQRSNYFDIELDPIDDRVVYLAQFREKSKDEKASGGLYRSNDEGESWTNITQFRNFEWGWKAVRKNRFGVNYIALSQQKPLTLYIATNVGQIFSTKEPGAPSPKWKQITTRSVGPERWATTGLEAIALPQSIEIDPAHPEVLYIAYGDHGIFKSEDGGKTVSLLPNRPGTYGGSLILDEFKPGRLYLGTRGPHLQLRDGTAWQSDDSGRNWRSLAGRKAASGKSLPPGAITSVRVQYVGRDGRNIYMANYKQGVYRLDDSMQWRQIFARAGCHALAARKDFQELYVGVDGEGIFKLTRQGDKWQSALVAPKTAETGETFFDMETGSETGTIYIGTSKGVFALTATDKLEKRLALPDTMALEVHPRNERIIYAGSPYQGLVKSTDRGMTWRNVSGDLPGKAVMVLKISPSETDTIYVASRCSGIWKKAFSSNP